MSVCYTNTVHTEARRGRRIPWNWSCGGCEPPCGSWELGMKPGSSTKAACALTTQASRQPPVRFIGSEHHRPERYQPLFSPSGGAVCGGDAEPVTSSACWLSCVYKLGLGKAVIQAPSLCFVYWVNAVVTKCQLIFFILQYCETPEWTERVAIWSFVPRGFHPVPSPGWYSAKKQNKTTREHNCSFSVILAGLLCPSPSEQVGLIFLAVYPQIINKHGGRVTPPFSLHPGRRHVESLHQFIVWIWPSLKLGRKKGGRAKPH